MMKTVMDSTGVPKSEVAVIRLERDYGSAQFLGLTRLEAQLHSALDLSPFALLLDLSGTSFIGAAFLSVLLRCRTRSVSKNCCLALCALKMVPVDVFSITRLNSILLTYRSREVALECLRATAVKGAVMGHRRNGDPIVRK
jgi:anti-anti-sigma regulatory factor